MGDAKIYMNHKITILKVKSLPRSSPKGLLRGSKLKTNDGFTLIETIIYIGIIAIIISSFLLISQQIIFSTSRTRHQIELTENQKFLVQKINWLLRNVASINTPLPDSSSNILSINKVNFNDNPIVLSLTNDVVYLTTGSTTTSTAPLTNNSVIVTSLTFYQLTFASSSQNAIRVVANMQNDVASTTIDKFVLIK